MNAISKFVNPIRELAPKERLFGLLIGICTFLVLMDYGIIRPTANSLFINHFGSGALPYAWLATTASLFLITLLFNHALSRFHYAVIFSSIAFLIILENLLAALFIRNVPQLSLVLYVWKDIYILLMVEQFWSLINSTFDTTKAKSLYGVFTAIGGIGGILGNVFCRALAIRLGSETLLFCTLPIYVVLLLVFAFAVRTRSQIPALTRAQNRVDVTAFSDNGGYRLIGKSSLLTAILILICFMQVATALTDFQFNQLLEKTIHVKDLRTQYFGEFDLIVNASTTVIQLFLAAPLLHLLELRRVHMGVPGVFLVNSLLFFLMPVLPMITMGFATLKTLDYSMFRIAKEILYIPCTVEEKYKTKAIIDVFAYRGMKALSSCLIIVLRSISLVTVIPLISCALMALFTAWLIFIPWAMRAYRTRLGENAVSV